MRFAGVDLAWKATNPSGAVVLEGRRFPLAVVEGPVILATHADVQAWLGAQVRSGPTVVGVDAPLLGLRPGRRRRPCDDAVSRAFGRFHASTHSLPAAPDLAVFVRALDRRFGPASLAPGTRPRRGRPALCEVYPNALQVRLFDLDRGGERIQPYKRRRFASKRAWVADGLRPFLRRCRRAIAGVYLRPGDPNFRALVAARPHDGMTGRRLKAIEDGWDAVLCALAVALDRLDPGSMHGYAGSRPGAWRQGYILAPALGRAAGAPGVAGPPSGR